MAFICAWCGSDTVQAGLDKVQCLACGNSSTDTGDRTVADSLAEEGVTVNDIPEPEEPPVEAPVESVPEPEPAEDDGALPEVSDE